MSAYGTIARPSTATAPLASTSWEFKPTRSREAKPGNPGSVSWLTVHHLTLATARALPGLIEYLSSVFAMDIEAGRTYPQEAMAGVGAFEAYFFAADVFVGIISEFEGGVNAAVMGIEEAKKARSWEDCVTGFYYVGAFSDSQ